MRFAAAACILGSTCGLLLAQDPGAQKASDGKGPLSGFDAFAAQQLIEFRVPGAAVAIVDRNGVLLSRGYGWRDAAEKKPVDSGTLFPLASATKPFTAIGLGTLVDGKKLDWDTPIWTYLPGFSLFDEYASGHITLRDLLSHRSGLPRYEGVWFGGTFDQEEMVRRLRFLEPSAEFRSTWQYSNMNFAIAGVVQGQADGGVDWETSAKKRVLDPLGMSSTSFGVEKAQHGTNAARSYGGGASAPEPIPFMNYHPVAAAGELNSTADDMVRFLMMLANRGKAEGKVILSEKRWEELITPVMVMPWKISDPFLGHVTYGLGWFVSTYRGHRMAWHWGSAWGFSTMVAVLPDDGFAVAVMANRGDSKLPDVLTYAVWDRLLGLTPVDWSVRYRPKSGTANAVASQPKKQRPSPSHPLADYAGRYWHPGYGEIRVEMEGQTLFATYNGFKVELDSAGYEVFEGKEGKLNPLSNQRLQFRLDVEGRVDAVIWDVEAGVPRAVFLRQAQ